MDRMIAKNEKNDVIVVIPIYKKTLSKWEDISLKRIIKIFSNRKVAIFSFEKLQDFIKTTIQPMFGKEIETVFFDERCFKNIISYNRLLMSLEFYQKFILHRYILICQLDVYVFNDDIDYWIGKEYDNIGAPIFEGYIKPSKEMKISGNNGGFCLRNVRSCIDVLNKIGLRYYSIKDIMKVESKVIWKIYRIFRDGMIYNYNYKFLKPIINEDIFWSIIVPSKFSEYVVCKPREAMYFSFDANPEYLYELTGHKLPMAIHAWWRYNYEFVLNLIEENKS